MLDVKYSTKFKKDFKLCQKRGYNMSLLKDVIDILRIPSKLERKYQNHPLSGNYQSLQECHILPDWLLIYDYTDEGLELVRTGTHSDLFKK